MTETEHDHQVNLFLWAKLQKNKYPELEKMYAIPNGGQRHKIVAAKLRAEGVKSGVPDVCLPVARGRYHSLYIELKRPKSASKRAGSVTKNQTKWIDWLTEEGNLVIVCYGWDAARAAILGYLGE